MMDIFYIVQYRLSQYPLPKIPSFYPLSSIKFTKINIENFESQDFTYQQNVMHFEKMDEDITQQKVLFKKMLQIMTKSVNQLMNNFVNVTFITDDLKIFTQVLPKQCQRRELNIPLVFMNYIDIKELLRSQYRCPYKKLNEIAEFLNICTLKQAETKSQAQILERILKKLHQDKKLSNTTERFVKKCERKQNKQLSGPTQSQRFKYFKIIGLPFKSFPAEILQILAPQVNGAKKDICFIYERQRFSGRGIIKIPEDYEKFLIQKNRMYIGPRYIQLQASTQEQFQKAKIRSQHYKQDKSLIRERDNYRPNRYENQRQIYQIGRRRSRSRSPPTHSRSREKQPGDYFQRIEHQNASQRPFQKVIPPGSGQYGIKVRGLPFSFSQWDVQNIFNYHNIVGGSVKLGIKPGTMMKNGQAVMLMRSYNDAQKALQMNGYRVMGRYLEVRVISKEDYVKYK